ncbi:hypothetical protein AMAG_13850 [Allomyces macrogynus ATCC 38327]|uniref:Ubiquitin fusion degradation protein UFD1 n=1 Tax=Allomyces macrogynus (strain ATCC 38327) TaxID=578462 RepID=A0A0L0T328_ALLM3|nr:hypothetical protein AMAG_13850 [Allomyces macrogynus ATCC 38327]|eukprot:KNE68974.1 hypothetical protein AMAG_13850 [Allomyces macrogynus ATCC 38327]
MFGGFMDHGGQFGFGNQRPGSFNEYYRCFSNAFMPGKERENANHGSKIFMPPSALMKLTGLHIENPYFFQLTNEATGKSTHGGVLEFVAEEGRVYVPRWMMASLGAAEGQLIKITNKVLPRGTFVKIEPQSVDFLEISDPKAVLERAFRNYSTLTIGDIISFEYLGKQRDVKLLEVKPANSVNILDTDLEVDFAPPVGYVEPTPMARGAAGSGSAVGSLNSIRDEVMQHVPVAAKQGWDALGAGQKLKPSSHRATTAASSNHAVSSSTSANSSKSRSASTPDVVGPAPLRVPLGQLFFGFDIAAPAAAGDGENGEAGDDAPVVFKGEGNVLKTRKGKGRAK